MDSDQSLADIGEATDSLDEYDLDESSSVDDGTLAPERYLDRPCWSAPTFSRSSPATLTSSSWCASPA
jgi:hypothetical protein